MLPRKRRSAPAGFPKTEDASNSEETTSPSKPTAEDTSSASRQSRPSTPDGAKNPPKRRSLSITSENMDPEATGAAAAAVATEMMKSPLSSPGPDPAPGSAASPGQTSGPPSPSEVLRPSENLPAKRRPSLASSETRSPESVATSPSNAGAKSSPSKIQPSTSSQRELQTTPPKASGSSQSPIKPRILEEYTIMKGSSKSPTTAGISPGVKLPLIFQSQAKLLSQSSVTTSLGSPISSTRASIEAKCISEPKKIHLMYSENEATEATKDEPSSETTESTVKEASPEKAQEQPPRTSTTPGRRRSAGPPLAVCRLFETKSQKRRLDSSESEKEESAPSTSVADAKPDLENQDAAKLMTLQTKSSGEVVHSAPETPTPVERSAIPAAESSTDQMEDQMEDQPPTSAADNLESEDTTTKFSSEMEEDNFSGPDSGDVQRPQALPLNPDTQTSVVAPCPEDRLTSEVEKPLNLFHHSTPIAGLEADPISITSTDAETPSKSEETVDSGVASQSVAISFPSEQKPASVDDLTNRNEPEESRTPSPKDTEESESAFVSKSEETDAKETNKQKAKKRRLKSKSGKNLKHRKYEYLYTESACAAASGSCIVAYKFAKHSKKSSGTDSDRTDEEKSRPEMAAEKKIPADQPGGQGAAGSEQGPVAAEREEQGPAAAEREEQGPAAAEREEQGPAAAEREEQGPAAAEREEQGPAAAEREEQGPAAPEREETDRTVEASAKSDEPIAEPPGVEDDQALMEQQFGDLTLSDLDNMSEHTEDWITYVTDDSDFDYDRRFQDFYEESTEEKEATEVEEEEEEEDDEDTPELAGTSARTRVREVIRRGGPAGLLLQAVRDRGDDGAAAAMVTEHLVQLAPDVCNRALAIAAAANMALTVRALVAAGANPLWRMPVKQGEGGPDAGRTAAHRAAQAGAFEALSALIEAFDRPRRLARAGDNAGETPLHIAARKRDPACLRLLLSVVMDPQPRNRDEETPLHAGAAGGNAEVVEMLLASGSAVDAIRREMETALHVAAYHRHGDVVSILIASGANVNAVDDYGNAALLIAIDRESPLPLVRALLAAGANVNHANKNGVTAMHAAATRRPQGTLEELLAAGALPDPANSSGCIPLHLSAFTAQGRKFERLLPLTPNAVQRTTLSGCTPFHSAVLGGNLDLIRTTISLGADIAACTSEGSNAVHMAASTGHVTVLRYLFSLGLSVNSRAKNGSTPLHEASTPEVVDVLLQAGADGNALMNRNESPLHRAAHDGRAAVIRRLAQCLGADVDMRQVSGYSPLQIAAYRGREAAVVELVRLGADVNRRNDMPSPLMSAAHHGLLRAVEALANAGARADEVEPSNERTPLHEAVLNQRDNVFEALVNLAGANLDQRDGNGNTALHLAARFDNTRLVLRLIYLGADPAIVDEYGMPPVHYAEHLSFKHCLERVKAMARLPFGAFSASIASASGLAGGQTDSVAVARAFLRDYQLDVRRRTRDGKKALHVCCMFGFDSQVRGLLVLGDDPSAPMKYRLRPLHLAAAYGHVSIITSLLDFGVDIEARRDNAMTALHEAAFHGHRDAVRELVRRGADPRARQASGRLPAHVAAMRGHMGVLQELMALDRRFNVNARDAVGITMLHYAAQSGSGPLVRWLVEKGAKINSREKSGRTPIYHAVYRAQKNTINELLALGADPHIRDNMGVSPLEFAKNHEHLEHIYSVLLELVGHQDVDFNPPSPRLPHLE